MPKPESVPEPVSEAGRPAARRAVPPLSPGVRRHLGRNLRLLYADTLAEPVGAPVSECLQALLDKLGAAPPRDPGA